MSSQLLKKKGAFCYIKNKFLKCENLNINTNVALSLVIGTGQRGIFHSVLTPPLQTVIRHHYSITVHYLLTLQQYIFIYNKGISPV
jgi:hypothetical protein